MFLLCTFIDQDRWRSAFEPLLYPTGLSFYRPFSYRREYFHPEEASSRLLDPATKLEYLSAKGEGFFGARFHDPSSPEHIPLFVPLRKITLVATEQGDGVNIFFRLGEFIEPESVNGSFVLPSLSLSGLLGDPARTKLFVELGETEEQISSKWTTTPEFDGARFWPAIEKSLSNAAKARIKNTLTLRLVRASGRGGQAVLEPSDIDPARHTWGYRLRQRNVYDLTLSYYRMLPNSPSSDGKLSFCLTNPVDELQSSRRKIAVTGNYRSEDLWIRPLNHTEAPVQLSLQPCTVDDASYNSERQGMIGLELPVTFDEDNWPKSRKINFGLSIGAGVIALFLFNTYMNAGEGAQKVLLVIVAALTSVALSAAKDVITYKEE